MRFQVLSELFCIRSFVICVSNTCISFFSPSYCAILTADNLNTRRIQLHLRYVSNDSQQSDSIKSHGQHINT